MVRDRRGTGRGPGAGESVGIQGILSGRERLSVQAGRLGRGSVLMVRRRSTVRFRKGAPSQRLDSKQSERPVGPKEGARLDAPRQTANRHSARLLVISVGGALVVLLGLLYTA